MAHVTFIHGIGNKPAPDFLLDAWERSLAEDDGIDLGTLGVTCSMAYWADILYSEHQGETLESFDVDQPVSLPDESWRGTAGDKERLWVDRLAARLDQMPEPEAPPPEAGRNGNLERLQFPVPATRMMTRLLLRDVHHYLYNSVHEPRPGTRYRVRDEVRARAAAALLAGSERDPPHVVVSHSLGTVVAYDCLKRLPDCPSVDGLITIGSPLGIEEIPEQLRPEWSPNDGFPNRRLAGDWVNVFDRLDPVAGTAPELGPSYRYRGLPAVIDIEEANWGRWRHDIGKYLRGRALRAELARLLKL